ncbi:retinoblastoma-binding protein 5 homolog isoform X2 [Xenia sp. Carnegie-2017]|uniref:retinoblastoma-binding protein 5 homolog isoform X2 n=1 Tax=Xenia sp. Carnegie-2017 TaxID=2897299 RepID=UPI001F04B0ED|nr:retinoblastoma-binding protein 5 homolog isoform X2 [Xenia sp. Carnegie-2017]
MNLELLQSFGPSYPEEYDGTLDCVSVAITCSFNRRGTLLAVGCNDGRIVIWDFLTRGISKIISAHIHPVCSVSWSRNGYKLLSASSDWSVSVWDVLSGECDEKYRFPSVVTKVQFHPRDNSKFLVCPMKQAPVLVHIKNKHTVLPTAGDSDQNVVASFDRKGEHIYIGNAKGKIIVVETETLTEVTCFKISSGTNANVAVKSIEFSRRGSAFLINSSDRIIRVFDGQIILACKGQNTEPEPIQKLQDLVNRTLWKKCCFSGDGEYIVAGSSRHHSLYIWEKGVGNLVKILHGTKGELPLDVVWHPVRPIIASIANGVVSVWAQNHVENWSAFAPDFKELEENVEYEEHESEFDIEDEDKEEEMNSGSECGDDVEVDVCAIERIPALCSSDEDNDEDENGLYYLPAAPEIDDPDETINPDSETYDLNTDVNHKLPVNVQNEPPTKKPKVIEVNYDKESTSIESEQENGRTKDSKNDTSSELSANESTKTEQKVSSKKFTDNDINTENETSETASSVGDV